MPEIVNDSNGVASGSPDAWLRTAQRIISSVGSLAEACIIKSNNQKMTTALDENDSNIDALCDVYSNSIMAELQKKCIEKSEEVEMHIREMEEKLSREKHKTAELKKQNINTSEMDEYFEKQFESDIKNTKEKGEGLKRKALAESDAKMLKIQREQSDRQIIKQATESVRSYLKEIIFDIDNKLKVSDEYEMLDIYKKRQLEETFRSLQYHYNKQFKF